jgi:hypothetical protein
MNISLPVSSGGWVSRHSTRALATSGRYCSAERSDFFSVSGQAASTCARPSRHWPRSGALPTATPAVPRSRCRAVRQADRGSLRKAAPTSAAGDHDAIARWSPLWCHAASVPSTHTRHSPAAGRYLTNTLSIIRRGENPLTQILRISLDLADRASPSPVCFNRIPRNHTSLPFRKPL